MFIENLETMVAGKPAVHPGSASHHVNDNENQLHQVK